MAASDFAGVFVPSDEQLHRVELQRSEFAFCAAKALYWSIRPSLHVGDAVSEGYARLVEAIKAGDRSVADQILRSWGVRRKAMAATLSRHGVRSEDMPSGENLEKAPVNPPVVGRLL